MALGGGGGGKASPNAVKAGEAFVDVYINDTRFMRGMDVIGNKIKNIGAHFTKWGLGLAAVGTAGILPVTRAIEGLQDVAKQGHIASAMGLTSEEFTGIAGIAKSAGEPIREFIESMVTLGRVTALGLAGKGEVAGEFFKGLNINAKEFSKLKADEQFFKFFEAVQKVEDPLSKVRYLMIAFGEDGGKFLLPLLSKTPQQLREMGKSLAVSGEDMKKAQAAQKEYIDATMGLRKAWRSVVVALAPTIGDFAKAIARVSEPIMKFVKDNADLIRVVAIVAAALTGLGLAFAILGIAITGFMTVLGLLKAMLLTVIGVLTSPFLLAITGVTTAIGGLIFAHDEFSGKSQTIADDAVQAWGSIKETAINAYEGIVAAIAKGDISTAFRIAWVAIKIIWNEGLLFLTKQWNKFKGIFVDGWHDMVGGIKIAFWSAISWVMKQFSRAVTFITRNAADLLDAVGLGDSAKAVRSVKGFSDEEINATRDDIIKEIVDKRRERQKASDEARAGDEKALIDSINALKAELNVLVAVAKSDGKGQGDPLISSALGTFLDQIMQNRHLWYKGGGKDIANTLGQAVRGAFGSRNYQGAFGVGPANKIQKDQLDTQKNMLQELQGIHAKVGLPVFE